MAFHEVLYPARLSYGSTGGPERRTEIVTLSNGFEERNSPWAHSRRRYDAGGGLRSLDDVAVLVAFFEARMGRLHGFRWKDWADYKSCPPSAAIRAIRSPCVPSLLVTRVRTPRVSCSDASMSISGASQ